MVYPHSMIKSADLDQVLGALRSQESSDPLLRRVPMEVVVEMENSKPPWPTKRTHVRIVSENGFTYNNQKTIEVQNNQQDNEKMLDKDAKNEKRILESLKVEEEEKPPVPAATIPQLHLPRTMNRMARQSDSKRKSNIFSRQMSKKGRNCIQKIVRSWWWTAAIACFTVYTLFSDDIKEICFDTSTSAVFDVMVYICMGVFVLEILLSLTNDCNYFLSFYFYLDVLSTVSMVMDLSYFSQTSLDTVSSLNNILRSAKTAKIGSRAGRIVRMFRIVGVLRLSKIFKEAEKVKQVKIERLDKELNKKREQREAEARTIKEQFADLESLK